MVSPLPWTTGRWVSPAPLPPSCHHHPSARKLAALLVLLTRIDAVSSLATGGLQCGAGEESSLRHGAANGASWALGFTTAAGRVEAAGSPSRRLACAATDPSVLGVLASPTR